MKHLVTTENIESVRETMAALDQADMLMPGCETWAITHDNGQRGQMTRWADGRGAICLGGDSLWGDWIDNALNLDDGGKYDENGAKITVWIIIDQTSNHGAYIGESGENVALEENARQFVTEDAATEYATRLDPDHSWSCVVERD